MTAAQLKASILDLAIRGQLVPQDPNDEPADALLERIWKAKVRVEGEQRNGSSRSGRARTLAAPQPVTDEDLSSVALAKEEKPFDLPAGWTWCRLGEIADVLAGYPFEGNGYTANGVKICGGLIIMPNEIKWAECKYWPTSQGLENFLLSADDIVIALDRPWINDGAKVGIIKAGDLPCLLIQRTARIRSKSVLPQYLILLLKHRLLKQHCDITEMTVPHISHKDIQTFPIPLPPLAEQRRIVAKIEELMPLVKRYEAAEQKRVRLDAALPEALTKSILKAAFDGALLEGCAFEEKSLSEACVDIFTGNSLSEAEKRTFTRPDGLPFIGTKDVGFDQVVDYENGIRIPESATYRTAPAGATLLCIEGGSSGRKIGLLNRAVRFGNKLCAFAPGKGLDSRYLFLYLQSPQFLEQFTALQNGPRKGAGISQIKALTIRVTDMQMQRFIVARIEEYLSQIDKIDCWCG